LSSFSIGVCSWQNTSTHLAIWYSTQFTMGTISQNLWFYIPIYFVCLWSGVSLMVSLIGGWFELGRAYRAVTPFRGNRWHLQDACLRFLTSYRGALTVGANAEGFYASVFPLFRIGHPPLFIPWQDVSVRPDKCLWVRVYEFKFRQVPTVRFRLREKIGKKIQEAAGSAWPGDRSATSEAF
jgi:hypothetical protein